MSINWIPDDDDFEGLDETPNEPEVSKEPEPDEFAAKEREAKSNTQNSLE
jgi:hypothetical protein